MLISIDTSAGTSVAVFDGAKQLSFVSFDDPFGHAENIGSAIEAALAEAGISREDLTAVAVGRGPAPYTGLRVGIAAAQLLARTLHLPISGVMVLDAIALGEAGRVVVSTDAKRKELFAAWYEDGRRIAGPEVISPQRLESETGFRQVAISADAAMVGTFAVQALSAGMDLGETDAIYLRSPDVTPSKGKRVSG
ncbi:MAG: tRNA (adenosine(37)-N6)-threonylcarbamoyltransferase complex dimerization subunit type 1 TsaB [Aquiluna sp.]